MLVIRNSKKQVVHGVKLIIFVIISIFSSTFAGESLILVTHLIESKERNALTDETIAVYVPITLTKYAPDVKILSAMRQPKIINYIQLNIYVYA
jgi:hypothetical protein